MRSRSLALALVLFGFVLGGAVLLFADAGSHSSVEAAGAPAGSSDATDTTSADGHDHGTADASGLTGDTPCELSGPPASEGTLDKGEGHNERGPSPQKPLTEEERVLLAEQQAQARAVALEFPNVAAAEAAGYKQSTVYVPGRSQWTGSSPSDGRGSGRARARLAPGAHTRRGRTLFVRRR